MNIELWKFLAGLGFFLFGMNQLESVLKNTSGRSLKLFLKRNTKNLFKAILGGAIVTGIVQSSSVVSLIVLAFVESGIFTFRNALAVILGTNLGTTIDSWLVATVGFKLDILNYALPVVAITSIGMFFFEKRQNLFNLFSIFFALGILFLGLGFMKEGSLALVKDFDLKTFSQNNKFVFALVGFVLTTIIQSSSATIAITLTAIYAGVINFPSAAAVVIGAEVGTTIKILLWGMKGSDDKKRVAWGNFIFNIFTAVIAFIFLHWLILFIEKTMKISDPLIGLVFFQSSINLVSILIFVPFLNIFSKWLENKFTSDDSNGHSYIGKNLPTLPVLATDTLKHETINLLAKSLAFIKNILCYENLPVEGLMKNLQSFTRKYPDIEEEYERLKQTEGDIIEYYTRIQENNLSEEDINLMMAYVNSARQAIYAAKAIKDIAHNLDDFESSADDILHQQGSVIHKEWEDFDEAVNTLILLSDKTIIALEIQKLLAEALELENKRRLEVISLLKANQLKELEASTLMNVNRELLSSKKSILLAIEGVE